MVLAILNIVIALAGILAIFMYKKRSLTVNSDFGELDIARTFLLAHFMLSLGYVLGDWMRSWV